MTQVISLYKSGRKFRKGISYDSFLILVLIIIPVAMFMLIPHDNNPYMDRYTPWIVLIISLFLILVIKINQYFMLPLMDVFVLCYVLYWHLRFLTLAAFPKYELVLTRTVNIGSTTFNNYALTVFIAIVSLSFGFFVASFCVRYQKFHKKNLTMETSIFAKSKFKSVIAYFGFFFMIQFLIMFFGNEAVPSWLSYLSLLGRSDVAIFCILYLLFTLKIKKQKVILVGFLLFYVLFMLTAGSRSPILIVAISVLIMMFIYNKKPNFKPKNLFFLLLGVAILFMSFMYATLQRQMKTTLDSNLSVRSIVYASQRMFQGDDQVWKRTMGLALARAGFLDFSAEVYANDQYDSVINIPNIAKSIIDNTIPGSLFKDSRRISYRMHDVYASGATIGYQSDAIGAVGEYYRLFGDFYPFPFFIIAFFFVLIFYSTRETALGIYFRYTFSWGIIYWWNSFGFDWFIIDFFRQLIIGGIIVTIVFFNWNAFFRKYILIQRQAIEC